MGGAQLHGELALSPAPLVLLDGVEPADKLDFGLRVAGVDSAHEDRPHRRCGPPRGLRRLLAARSEQAESEGGQKRNVGESTRSIHQ